MDMPFDLNTLIILLRLLIPTLPRDPKHKIHNNSRKQRNRQHCRAQPIIKAALAPHSDRLSPPMKREQRVDHRRHGHDREASSRDAADAIAEVEEPDCQSAEYDGEVQPREEGALVREEDFRLDTRG